MNYELKIEDGWGSWWATMDDLFDGDIHVECRIPNGNDCYRAHVLLVPVEAEDDAA